MKEYPFTNHLINESSPYLVQHAHNPVNWYPWGAEALEIAKNENKLIIISIGYAACHWCHVMAHESFEDIAVAGFINENFIAIKVDREERPDVDQIYMNAVQILTGSGGWPLNIIALPDGRPVYGGTYFPKERWLQVLKLVSEYVKQNHEQAEAQANTLTSMLKSGEQISTVYVRNEFTADDLTIIFKNWRNNFDTINGGYSGAPKFPLPAGYLFLLQYSYLTNEKDALEAVTNTLNKMAFGGIYDQLGGGFARYSTDSYWRVPHFEKMLYDNSQLVSLYASAYQATKEPLYKNIVYETLGFIEREMTSKEGAFFSSLDADSEGEEGKFYVWTKAELENITGNDAASLVTDYFNVKDEGNWEKGKNILYRKVSDKEIAEKYKISEAELNDRITSAKSELLRIRSKRERPGTDDKILTGWNALMLKGYTDAFRVFGEKKFLDIALNNAGFILQKMKIQGNRMDRCFKNGKTSVNAFLDDYAFTIEAFISLYQSTFNEKWLHEAKNLIEYTLLHFYEPDNGMFYYTSDLDPALIARKTEITDNVIPSANSTMAKNLFLLGKYFYDDDYIDKSGKMAGIVKPDALRGAAYYGNWDILMAWLAGPFYEAAIVGEEYEAILREFENHYLPNVLFSGGKDEGTLTLLENKLSAGQTKIYVCQNKVCKLPVNAVNEALLQIIKVR